MFTHTLTFSSYNQQATLWLSSICVIDGAFSLQMLIAMRTTVAKIARRLKLAKSGT